MCDSLLHFLIADDPASGTVHEHAVQGCLNSSERGRNVLSQRAVVAELLGLNPVNDSLSLVDQLVELGLDSTWSWRNRSKNSVKLPIAESRKILRSPSGLALRRSVR